MPSIDPSHSGRASLAPAREPGIAVLGGSFDPPHGSHLRLATTAAEQLRVAQVLVIPTGDHPHKRGQLTAAQHRLAMCQLAFAGLPKVRVDARELRRAGPAFTVDTLAELAAEFPQQPLFWLIGSDNLPLLPTWREHHRLLQLATVVTYPRAGHPVSLAALRNLDLTPAEQRHLLDHVLLVPDALVDDQNASAVRAAVRAGRLGELALPPGVAAYIETHQLYR